MPRSGEQPQPKKTEVVTGGQANWSDFGQVGPDDLNKVSGIQGLTITIKSSESQTSPQKKKHWWQQKGPEEKAVEPEPTVDDYRVLTPDARNLSVSNVRSEAEKQAREAERLGRWARKQEEKRLKAEKKRQKEEERKRKKTGVDPKLQPPLIP